MRQKLDLEKKKDIITDEGRDLEEIIISQNNKREEEKPIEMIEDTIKDCEEELPKYGTINDKVLYQQINLENLNPDGEDLYITKAIKTIYSR